MKHLDLFSGIGGFALAAKTVWGGEYENIGFCEINKFCQAVLRKNFGKDIRIYEDIRRLTANTNDRASNARIIPQPNEKEIVECGTDSPGGRDRLTANTNRQPGSKKINATEAEQQALGGIKRSVEPPCICDLLTGGFPCQPFSQAGKRKGTDDDRYLWPEMLRVIKEFQPRWIIGENVAGILSMAQYESGVEVGSETDLFGNKTDTRSEYGRGILYGIICDLEQIGYSVQAFVIPACAVNAPHRRDRVWIVAHAGHGNGQGAQNNGEPEGQIPCPEDAIKSKRSNSDARKESAFNTASIRCNDGFGDRKRRQVLPTKIRQDEKNKQERNRRKRGVGEGNSNASDATSEGLERYSKLFQKGEISELKSNSDWSKNWLEVATELCGVDDGLPVELDEFKLSKSKHREEQLKALGNAIVPQVAIEIMRAIKETNQLTKR